LDIGEIERLAELARRHGLEEVEVERDGVRVCLRRGRGPAEAGAADRDSHGPREVVREVPEEKEESLASVSSPMVGTFYRSPAPGQPALVEVGSAVAPSTTVCIIEAMKVMNEIAAEVEGTVVEVLARDGQAVEFGQALFRIAPK
jgi:acetyl-CoA carboxylase biotin carboxyl carrier protein